MFALLSSGIFGTLCGGLFRLVPEVLKFMDKKNDRTHELAMFDRQCDLEKVRGALKLQEIGANHSMAIDDGVLGAFKSAIDSQTEMVKAAGGWAASLSAAVRPVLTYYLLLMYGAVKVCLIAAAYQSGVELGAAIIRFWTNEDMALLCGVVNFWMLDRTLAKRGL